MVIVPESARQPERCGWGLRVRAHTVHEAQRNRSRTEFTATSDRVRTAPSGETRATESPFRHRETDGGTRSDRVVVTLRGGDEDGDLMSRSGSRTDRRGDRTGCRPSGRGPATKQWCRAEHSQTTPTGLETSVLIGSSSAGSGNRVGETGDNTGPRSACRQRVRKAASPAASQRRLRSTR